MGPVLLPQSLLGPGGGPSIRFLSAGQGPKKLRFYGIVTCILLPNDILLDNEDKGIWGRENFAEWKQPVRQNLADKNRVFFEDRYGRHVPLGHRKNRL